MRRPFKNGKHHVAATLSYQLVVQRAAIIATHHWQAFAGKARTIVGVKPAYRALRPP